MEGMLAGTKILSESAYAEHLKLNDRAQMRREILKLQENLIPFVAKGLDILDGLNLTRPVMTLNCKNPNYTPLLSGNARSRPARVIQSFHFSAESHLLALRLLMFDNSTTDKLLLTEGDVSHINKIPKPMIYDKIKHLIPEDQRQRIIYFPIKSDYKSWDAPWHENIPFGDLFNDEKADREMLWRHLRGLSEYNDDTVVTYGDADEFPSDDLLFHLKNCELKRSAPLPFASSAPFVMQDFRYIFRNDHPSLGPFCLRFPTIWTLGALRSQDYNCNVFRAGTPALFPLVPGGFHWTNSPFIPALFFKVGTAPRGLGLDNRQVISPLTPDP